MPKTKKEACELCCDPLEKGQETLKCEGDCGCTVHRYCAGVTRRGFEELAKSNTPFVCQWCHFKTTHAIIQQLQSEVASLKLELAEAKALAVSAKQAPPITKTFASATTSRLPGQPSSSRQRPTRRDTGGRRQLQQSRSRRSNEAASPTDSETNHQNRAASSPIASGNHRTARRVRVEGVRRVWNTYIHASSKTIENAISRFCGNADGLQIRRKTRTNNRTGKLNWWFVVHAEENMLCELESKWENLQTQTSWVLEHCTKPYDDANTDTASTTNSNSDGASTNTLAEPGNSSKKNCASADPNKQQQSHVDESSTQAEEESHESD